jgi:PhzF family phenazine biosynthesis protein
LNGGVKGMKQITVYHYDAFTSKKGQGNPAGIVIDNTYLTDDEMQAIAHKIGFNETVFIVKAQKADLGMRYFTPGHEINLCGHGTIATLYALKTKGLLQDTDFLTIETKAGVLPIQVFDEGEKIKIRMTQTAPQFEMYKGSKEMLAEVLEIDAADIHPSLPIVYGSTGAWTLLVPVTKLETFMAMKPKNHRFPEVLTQMPRASIHPFCLETIDASKHMHARHFSSPYSGTIEDAVTGTASGVMGAYYAIHIKPDASQLELVVEQGQEIGRDGAVYVHIKRQEVEIKVEISGTAVYVDEIRINL